MLGGGLQNGEMAILAARPSMGKSSLALNIVVNACLDQDNPRSAAVFALESNAATLLTRMMCAEGRVDAHRFRSGYLNADERRRLQLAIARLADSRIWISDNLFQIAQIAKEARRLVKGEGCQLVVVDHLQLVGSRGRAENRNQEIGSLSRELKLLCDELMVPFLVLSQLSRANEKRPGDKIPILSDLRDGGSIEQDADTVMFIHRPEVFKRDDTTLKGLAELYLSKQRNGDTGKIDLTWISGWTKFENRSRDMFNEPQA
jgi:replicative DNA helicase